MDPRPFPGPSWRVQKHPSRLGPVILGSADKKIEVSSDEGEGIDEDKDSRPSPSKIPKLSVSRGYRKLQYANNFFKAAYLEVMTLAKEVGTWVQNTPAVGDLDDLLEEFRTPPPPGKRIEFSFATASFPNVPALSMAHMMMDVPNQWCRSLFPFVTYGEAYGVTGALRQLNTTDVTILNVVQAYAEMQLPSTMVPKRHFEFLRYLKEIVRRKVYIIVDVSDSEEHFTSSFAVSNCKRRPSGVIIREDEHNSCEIIWIENMEVDVTSPQNMYSSIIDSKLPYSADRFVKTLLWTLKRNKSSFSDNKIDVDFSASSFLLNLTDAMKRFFVECASEHPNESILSVRNTSVADSSRILYNKTVTEDMTFVGVKSFRVQATPHSVLLFLMKKDIELEFRMFADMESDDAPKEPEEVVKFSCDENIISLYRGIVEEETVYILQEATIDEHCSFILSKTLSEEAVYGHIVCGDDSMYNDLNSNMMANMTPIGFAIVPDGPGGLKCEASLVTFIMQIYYDPSSQTRIGVESVRREYLNDLNGIIRELNEKVAVSAGGKGKRILG